MPKLFDLLSERSDKNALKKLQKNAQAEKRKKKFTKKNSDTVSPVKTNQKTHSMFIPNYVAIDVETTGLDAKNNRIMEVGAVKFIHGKPTDTFQSLVQPGQQIPPKIIELTGITDEDVADAPLFKDIAADLLSFIGHLSLCGHQVEFDFNFINAELKRAGLEQLKNKKLDTAVLSRLLLFGLPGYSLANVCRHLGISQKNAHRALDDAMTCGSAASILIPQIGTIPERIRSILGQFAPYSLLKTILVKSVSEKGITDFENEITFPKPYPKLPQPDELKQIDRINTESWFSENGDLSRLMDGYTCRPSQIQMACDVTDAVNNQTCFVAEAGTGTGKSLAYLLPAASWALANNCRVLVSTHTKNLQDQLVTKDLPIVSKVIGKKLKFSVLKGRSNYLCRNRWGRFLAGEIGNISVRERHGILPLIRWAEETTSGDIEAQNQFNRRWFRKVWSFVSAESHGCLGRHCPSFNSCFLQHARQNALGSHIVVINHALFFSEVCAETSFLGRTTAIIFDEAHHLESCGHRHLRVELDTNRINRYIESLNNLVKMLEKSAKSPDEVEKGKKYKNILKRLRKNGSQLLHDIRAWAGQELSRNEQEDTTTHYLFAYRDNPFSGSTGLAGFELILKDIQDSLFSLGEIYLQQDNDFTILRSEIAGCQDKTSQLKADCTYLVNAFTDDHVFWVEGDRQKGWVKLCGVPLDIGGLLHDIWQQNHHAILFTSATMTVAGSIDYFKRKVGLMDDLEERTCFESFRSPFSDEQMFRCAVNSARTPDSDGYDGYIGEVIIRLLKSFDKNILVLFTANTMMYDVHMVLKESPDFPDEGTLLTQGLSGTRANLLETFKDSKRSVLLGTASFWEGIDAPGESCEIVVVPRLPFTVPTHPLTRALAQKIKEQFGDSFFKFSVPEAVIRFRQGAGRLIRTGTDRGAFIVLDGRIISKNYGKVFTRSLLGPFIKSADVDEMIGQVTAFFKDK